jgi:hypothetical protein
MTWPPSTIIPIPRHECELIIRGRKAEGGLEKAIHFDASGALATFPARAARPGALTRFRSRRERRFKPPFSKFDRSASESGEFLALFFNCLRALRKRAVRKCRKWVFDRRGFEQNLLKLVGILVSARFGPTAFSNVSRCFRDFPE